MTAVAQGYRVPAMPRPSTGTVVRKPTVHGISYALKVTHQGERYFVRLGGSWEGWDEDRVQREREYIRQQIDRGEWVPPRRDAAGPAQLTVAGDVPTFQVFASEHAARRRRRLSENAYKDLVWRLMLAMDHFGPYQVDRITEAVIDDFTDAMIREREQIRAAAASGKPVMQTIELPDGRTYQRRQRPLSNDSINKAISAVRQVLKDAMRRYPQQVVRNAASDREVYLKVPPAKRSFLEPHHIGAAFDAARQLDGRKGALDWDKVEYIRASDRSNSALARDLGVSDVLVSKIRRGLVWTERATGQRPQRLAVVATLVLAGPRVSELCGLPEDRVDLPGGRILIPPRDGEHEGPQTKTFAGERVIPTVPALREILVDARAEGTQQYVPGRPRAAFLTSKGTPQTPSNVAHRVLEPVIALAEELLRQRGQTPMPHVTPHTLRRTFASILAECDVNPRRAMYLMGHTDAKLTLSVYQQVLDMSGDAVDTLEEVLGCTLDEAHDLLGGRRRRRATPIEEVDEAINELLDGDR